MMTVAMAAVIIFYNDYLIALSPKSMRGFSKNNKLSKMADIK